MKSVHLIHKHSYQIRIIMQITFKIRDHLILLNNKEVFQIRKLFKIHLNRV